MRAAQWEVTLVGLLIPGFSDILYIELINYLDIWCLFVFSRFILKPLQIIHAGEGLCHLIFESFCVRSRHSVYIANDTFSFFLDDFNRNTLRHIIDHSCHITNFCLHIWQLPTPMLFCLFTYLNS